jgi:hypothetical protein
VSLVTNNISGSANNNSKIGVTGSVIFANTTHNDFPTFPGADVVFFVSGSIGDQFDKKSVFGGDLVISGSLTIPANVIEVTGSIEATLGFSGSLTQLTDGTSYLIAGQNVTIVSQSNGSITISAQGGVGGGYEQSFVDGDLVGGVLSVNHGLSNDYVHVSVYDNNDYLIIPDDVIITGIGTVDIVLTSFTPLASPGNWNVIVSAGSAEPAPPVNSIQYNSNGLFAGSANFTYNGQAVNLTGSLQNGFDSKTTGVYSHAEGDTTIASGAVSHSEGITTSASGDFSHAEGANSTTVGVASHAEGESTISIGISSHAEGIGSISYGTYSHAQGQYTIASGSAQNVCGKYNVRDNDYSLFVVGNGTGDLNADRSDIIRVNSDDIQLSGSLLQLNKSFDGSSVGFMGNDSGTTPSNVGPDVFFFVSGSKNSKDGSTPTVAVFGGDVVISGTLHGGSPLNIGSPVFTNFFYSGNSESIRPLTAPVTVNADVTTHVTTIETVAPGNTTVILADGLLVGQQKYIIGAVVTDPIVITPTTPHGFSTITISLTGGSALLLWTPYGWTIISTHDATIV